MPRTITKVGKAIRARRESLHLTQSQLGALIPTHQSCISRLENGFSTTTSTMSLENFCLICDVLELEIRLIAKEPTR